MNKQEFLNELRNKLSGLPKNDIEERISYYSEMIDGRMEEGMTEEDAVAGIGAVDTVMEQMVSEIPLTKLVRETAKPKRKLKAGEIVLLVLASPVWIPLGIAAVAVLLALYAVIWAVVVCVYAVDLSLAAGALSGLLGTALYLKAGNPAGAMFSVGAGAVCAGLAIFLFFACVWITKGVLKGTGRILLGIKTSFVGKRAEI